MDSHATYIHGNKSRDCDVSGAGTSTSYAVAVRVFGAMSFESFKDPAIWILLLGTVISCGQYCILRNSMNIAIVPLSMLMHKFTMCMCNPQIKSAMSNKYWRLNDTQQIHCDLKGFQAYGL